MDRNITQLSVQDDAINAARDALLDMGYTREKCPDRDLTPEDFGFAAQALLHRIAKRGDAGWIREFIVEARDNELLDLGRALGDDMAHCSTESARGLQKALHNSVADQADPWIRKAFERLPSASEIERGRKVDQDIDERKSA